MAWAPSSAPPCERGFLRLPGAGCWSLAYSERPSRPILRTCLLCLPRWWHPSRPGSSTACCARRPVSMPLRSSASLPESSRSTSRSVSLRSFATGHSTIPPCRSAEPSFRASVSQSHDTISCPPTAPSKVPGTASTTTSATIRRSEMWTCSSSTPLNPAWVWSQIEAIPMEGGFLNKWHARIPIGPTTLEIVGVCSVQLDSAGKIRRNEVYFDRSRLLAEIAKYK